MGLPGGAVTVIIISVICLCIAYLALGARLWSRRIMKLRLAFDDYAVITATVLATGLATVFFLTITMGGLGYHFNDLSPSQQEAFLKLFIPKPLLWGGANTCVKLSIVSLYIRIFPNPIFRKICYVTIGITICYFGGVLMEPFLPCHPIAYNWDKSIPGGHCENQNQTNFAVGVTNLVIDLLVVALPMPMLWKLQLTLSRKLQVMGMFGLGAIICIISLQRVLWFKNWDVTDTSYTSVGGDYWSILEPSLGIVNACLPTMQPVLRKIFRDRFTSWGSKSNSHNQSNKVRLQGSRNTASNGASVGDKRSFVKLREGQYPLAELQDKSYQVPELQGASSPSQSLYLDASEEEQARLKGDPDRIRVVRSWEVESTERTDNHV